MSPTMAWRVVQGKRCLHLRFEGRFTLEDCREALRTLAGRFREEDPPITMVWECTEMTGFDTQAREAWGRFLRANRYKIAAIHLIADKVLIRTGGMGVGVFARIPVTPWRSLAELEV